MSGNSVLFKPFSLGSLELANRIVMAPMTRNKSPGNIPGDDVVEYYRRRAAGGVGLTAVEIGKLMGAQVVACARGAAKLEAAKAAGADHLIDAETQDIRAEMKALGGADVVYDPVGGEQFKAAFRSCKPEARLLPIGFASGDIPQIKSNHLLVKNLSVLGVYWGGYLQFRPDVVTQSLATLMEWYSAGKLKPHVSHTLGFDGVADGLELLRSRKSTGKVVIQLVEGD